VLELSSFQLDDMYKVRMNVAILLNITPDHLDRYDYQFQNYVDSKFRILQNMTPDDTFIFYQESPVISEELPIKKPVSRLLPISLIDTPKPGAYLNDGLLVVNNGYQSFEIALTDLPLKGKHNAINMLAATLAAQSVGVKPEAVREGLQTFQNAAHRLEPAGEINGVQFINDSKATNVDSVYYALESMTTPVVWIAGGLDKGNEYDQLAPLVREKVKALICLGKDNRKLVDYFSDRVPALFETQDINEAVAKGLALANPGDTVLLSPACASFDLFRNYQDRGDQFKEAVKRIMNDELRVKS
jgi:UDP-N-acetylmuramoylalanine--D-glutamate ligase